MLSRYVRLLVCGMWLVSCVPLTWGGALVCPSTGPKPRFDPPDEPTIPRHLLFCRSHQNSPGYPWAVPLAKLKT
jgi:hypothetical protein